MNYIHSNDLVKCGYNIPKYMPRLIEQYKDKTDDFIYRSLSNMKYDTDNISQNTLDFVYTCLKNYIYTNGSFCCPLDFEFSINEQNRFKQELKDGVYNEFKVKPKVPEVFLAYHGLKYAKQPILDYINNRDFIDAGAFIGDSALVLSNFTERKVYSYEPSFGGFQRLKKTIKINNKEGKILPQLIGLSNENSFMYTSSKGDRLGNHLLETGNISVNITTIDDEVRKKGIKLGFIKADIEGFEYKMLMGARNSIKKYRPVLSISLYHNENCLFFITDYLKSFPNYHFEYRAEGHSCSMNELIVFAYPIEIGLYNNPFNDVY